MSNKYSKIGQVNMWNYMVNVLFFLILSQYLSLWKHTLSKKLIAFVPLHFPFAAWVIFHPDRIL